MVCVHYENYKGGVNNMAVAVDSRTGISATSTKGAKAAEKNLKAKLRKRGW